MPYHRFKSFCEIISMAKLQINVHGCGYSNQCVGVFSTYEQLVQRWGYGDQVEMSYQVEPGRDTPLIVASVDGSESMRWDKIPSPNDFRDYLRSKLGKPKTEKPARNRSGVSRVPLPWGSRAAML